MKSKIRILSDKQGQVKATVDIDGAEYEVSMCSIGVPTDKRNQIIRELAQKQARGDL